MKTRTITTKDGSKIVVPVETSDDIIQTLKHAKVYRHSEWHYTGDHPNGQNIINYHGKEELIRVLDLCDDKDTETEIECWGEDDEYQQEVMTERAVSAMNNNDAWMYAIDGVTGFQKLGKHLVHIQAKKSDGYSQFGFHENVEYRIIH